MTASRVDVLPKSWHRTVQWLIDEGLPDRGPVWIGEAGLFVPPPEASHLPDPSPAMEWLIERRFPGMHPALLPFAEDGAGNLFCLCLRDDGEEPAVVYWMYETFAALPIAGTFSAFLDWIGLTAAYAARQRLHPVLDEAHLHEVVIPSLTALGRTVRYTRFFEESGMRIHDLHRAIVEVDPGAAASHLMLAQRAEQTDMLPLAIERCDRALATQPNFTLAATMRGDLRRSESSWRAHEDFFIAFLGFHGFGGDAQMPWYGSLPVNDASRLAELLSTGPDVTERAVLEPVWELILHDDPTSAESWLGVALAHLEDGHLDTAVDMAVNALYFGIHDRTAPEIAALLVELYEALERPWHARIIARDAERLERRQTSSP